MILEERFLILKKISGRFMALVRKLAIDLGIGFWKI